VIEPNGKLVLDVAPVRAEPAGVGLYAARLAHELVKRAPFPFGLIGVRAEAVALRDIDPSTPLTRFSKRSYHAWLQLAAESDARAQHAQLIHFTNAAAPFIGRLPFVVTVHDLSLMRMPMTHPASRWGILPVNLVAIARARTLIVPSRWTARELERIGVDRRRIVVIPHAPTLRLPDPGTDGVARMGLRPRSYVLYVGTLEPRKNLIRLVGAFERVARDQPDLRLVLAGAKGWRYSGIERRIADSPYRERIDMPGYVADVDLAQLIVESAAVAYVSVYEGFGLPVLDAMALGAAVVTSRTTSMPEAAGGAAVLVDPRDEADIARGITAALARRSELVERGHARAAARAWADVADDHIRVYGHVMRRL
jgi:glycosyltransferase involved in cell wall biosynthesis